MSPPGLRLCRISEGMAGRLQPATTLSQIAGCSGIGACHSACSRRTHSPWPTEPQGWRLLCCVPLGHQDLYPPTGGGWLLEPGYQILSADSARVFPLANGMATMGLTHIPTGRPPLRDMRRMAQRKLMSPPNVRRNGSSTALAAATWACARSLFRSRAQNRYGRPGAARWRRLCRSGFCQAAFWPGPFFGLRSGLCQVPPSSSSPPFLPFVSKARTHSQKRTARHCCGDRQGCPSGSPGVVCMSRALQSAYSYYCMHILSFRCRISPLLLAHDRQRRATAMGLPLYPARLLGVPESLGRLPTEGGEGVAGGCTKEGVYRGYRVSVMGVVWLMLLPSDLQWSQEGWGCGTKPSPSAAAAASGGCATSTPLHPQFT